MLPTLSRYRAFVLRLWEERGWPDEPTRRFSQDPHTGQRRGFASLEALVAFLQVETAGEGKSSVVQAEMDGSS